MDWARPLDRRRLVAMAAGLTLPSLALRTVSGSARRGGAGALLGHRDGTLAVVDPHSGVIREIDIPAPARVVETPVAGVVIVRDTGDRQWLVRLDDDRVWPRSVAALAEALVHVGVVSRTLDPPRWSVMRTAADEGMRVVVRDTHVDRIVLDETFRRRIELAASAVSTDGRFTLHVQGNNVASEITVLDAQTAGRRSVMIPHDAELAAFAISIAFGPEAMAAVSMERADTVLPQTWLIELADDRAPIRDIDAGLVLAWVPLGSSQA